MWRWSMPDDVALDGAARLEHRVKHPAVRDADRRVGLHDLPVAVFPMKDRGHTHRDTPALDVEPSSPGCPAHAAFAERIDVVKASVDPQCAVWQGLAPQPQGLVETLGPLRGVGADPHDAV